MSALRIFRSTDGGKTWDAGRNIDLTKLVLPDGQTPVEDFFKPNAGFHGGPTNVVAAYGRIIELSDGTIVLPFYIEGNSWVSPGPDGDIGDTGRDLSLGRVAAPTYALMARSRNDGKTWSDVSLVSVDFNEWGLLETPDGELLAVMRGQTTHQEWAKSWKHLDLHSLTGFIRSLDKGRTWSRYEIIAGNWTRDEHASDIVRLADGTLIVPTIRRTFVNPTTFAWRGGTGRGVPVTVSYDNGVTWSKDYRIAVRTDVGGSGWFPSSVVLEDDTIVTVDGHPQGGGIWATRWKLPAEMRKYGGEASKQGIQEKQVMPDQNRLENALIWWANVVNSQQTEEVQRAAVAELLLVAKDIRKRKLAQGLTYREGRFLQSNDQEE